MKLSREKVNMIMCRNKWSQRDIAEALDVSTATVSRYLKNCDRVMNKTIGRLADALQVEVEEIIE